MAESISDIDHRPIFSSNAAGEAVLRANTDESSVIEQLGRRRPAHFRTTWAEAGFVACVITGQLLTEYFISGFMVLTPSLVRDLGITRRSSTWPTSAFCLTIAAFLLPFGRFVDMYGGLPLYVFGCTWTCLWSVIAGFSKQEIILDISRAMQGFGTAATLPASLALLGSSYRPGPRKNMVFSLCGAMAPLGFFLGIFVAGMVSQYGIWRWYFWIGACLYGATIMSSCLFIPRPRPRIGSHDIQMDWLGAVYTAAGLILLSFSLTDSAHAPQGWRTPYIYATFVSGIVAMALAFCVEGWWASQPLIPFTVFKTKHMCGLWVSLLFGYGTIGVFMLYTNLFIQNINGISTELAVAWYSPMAIAGCAFAILGGFIFHAVPGTILFILSDIAIVVAALLFALIPDHASHWAWILPAMICATFSIDTSFSLANVFLSTTLPAQQQGLAGSIANLLLYVSMTLLLGIAEAVSASTKHLSEEEGLRRVFWFELACGACSLIIGALFVRIEKAKSDYTIDEKRLDLEKQLGPEQLTGVSHKQISSNNSIRKGHTST